MAIESPGRRGSLSSSCPMPPTRTAPPEAGGLRPRSGPRPPRDAPPPPPLSPEPCVCSSPKVEQASSLSGHSLGGSSLGAGVDASSGSAPHRGGSLGRGVGSAPLASEPRQTRSASASRCDFPSSTPVAVESSPGTVPIFFLLSSPRGRRPAKSPTHYPASPLSPDVPSFHLKSSRKSRPCGALRRGPRDDVQSEEAT